MYVILQGCNQACNCCCNLEECCEKNCSACAKIFNRPFSLCTLGAVIFAGIPALVGIIISFAQWGKTNDYCEKPLNVHLLISGVFHLINVAYCFYLTYKFSHPSDTPGEGPMARARRMALYDWPTCLMTLALLFELIWAIVGVAWIGQVDSLCAKEKASLTFVWTLLLAVGFLLFIVLGFMFGALGLIYQACSDGELGCCGLAKIALVICTCGVGGLFFLVPGVAKGKNRKEKKYEEKYEGMSGAGYSGGAADGNQKNSFGQQKASAQGPVGVSGGQQDPSEPNHFSEMQFHKKSKKKAEKH